MGIRSITSPAATSSFSSLQPAVVLLMILQLTGFIAATTSSPSQRIAEGETTTLGQYPSVVSLGISLWGAVFHLHFCAGFIITESWIITTARCVDDAVGDPSWYYWLVGTNHLRDGGIQYDISQIIIHPDHNPNDSLIHDIALSRVVHPFEFSFTIQPIELSLATPEAASGTPGKVVGWGQVSQIMTQPNILRTADVTILDIDVCREIYSPWDMNIDGEYQFCAVTAVDGAAKYSNDFQTNGELEQNFGLRSACRGDEGGPFFPRGTDHPTRALGFVSWTYLCSPSGFPAVYTKLSGYYDWISDVTGLWII